VVIMPGTSSWQLRDGEQIIACNTSLLAHKHFLIGITRVRNEALILRDTLDYVGKHVDAIVAYDDASSRLHLPPFPKASAKAARLLAQALLRCRYHQAPASDAAWSRWRAWPTCNASNK
jgi:hypothetical protein